MILFLIEIYDLSHNYNKYHIIMRKIINFSIIFLFLVLIRHLFSLSHRCYLINFQDNLQDLNKNITSKICLLPPTQRALYADSVAPEP